MSLRRRFPTFGLVALLLAAGLVGPRLAADDKPSDEATTLAKKILDEGATEFSRKNAKVMARSYTEDADLRLITREGSSFKTEAHHGRAEIESAYERLFNNEDKFTARNTVEHARFLAKDLLSITGTFEPNTAMANLKVSFIQIRQKVDKDWLIRDMQVYFVPDQN